MPSANFDVSTWAIVEVCSSPLGNSVAGLGVVTTVAARSSTTSYFASRLTRT